MWRRCREAGGSGGRARARLRCGRAPVAATAKRILLTGAPGGAINKVGKVIEEHGGVIVCLDDCSGESEPPVVDEDADDILRAISDRYLAVNCSVMTPTTPASTIRRQWPALPRRRRGGGGAASPPHVQRGIVPCAAAHGGRGHPVPLETDYSAGDGGQVGTRLAAFIEML
ncbi:MAG: 2-hydroxyacyl-CoA dehydratase [Eggerthellaceae bacterium]